MIDILLPTYNGERYIEQQIESLLAQTFGDWQLIIRDDESSDDTAHICQHCAKVHPGKIRLLNDVLGRLGLIGNVNELISHSKSAYVMFCDQDDVWLPRKIEKTLDIMHRAEGEYGDSMPILAHSDSQVVDEKLQTIAPSLLKFVHRAPNPSLSRLCMELPIYGHSVMINRSLVRIGGMIPGTFHSWDWYYPLVAVVFGRIVFLDEPLTLFRRHAGTSSSEKKHALLSYLAEPLAEHRRRVHISFRQCEVFYEKFGSYLDAKHQSFFASVSAIRSARWITRKRLVLRHKLFKTGLLKTAGLLLVA